MEQCISQGSQTQLTQRENENTFSFWWYREQEIVDCSALNGTAPNWLQIPKEEGTELWKRRWATVRTLHALHIAEHLYIKSQQIHQTYPIPSRPILSWRWMLGRTTYPLARELLAANISWWKRERWLSPNNSNKEKTLQKVSWVGKAESSSGQITEAEWVRFKAQCMKLN